jgi:uncharacterized protein (TIGR02757 family)
VEREADPRDKKGLIGIGFFHKFHFTREQIIKLEDIYEREKAGLGAIICNDPVEFVHKYTEPGDKEIVGFLASQFAYGRIEVMKRFLRSLFERMGKSPAEFVRAGNWSRLEGLYYRFQKGDEIVLLFTVLRKILTDYGSIGGMFRSFHEDDTRETLWRMRKEALGNEKDLIFFFPKRLPGNPLKRWNLYLRWMVRKDDIDQGLWDFMDKRDLVTPLDTHLFKIGRCCGWTERRSPSWNAAQDVTRALRRLCPDDPLKYDFLLCHKVGIGASCTGTRKEVCTEKCMLIK